MRWWKVYCCCSGCWNPPTDERLLNDCSSSLMQQQQPVSKPPSESQGFCIPRRHSSFNATNHREVASTRRNRCHSSSSSSSSDEEGGTQQRGRSFSADSDRTTEKSRSSSFSNAAPKADFQLEQRRHILTEIAESTEEEEPPKQASDVYGYITFFTVYDERELRLRVFVEKASSLPKKSPQEAYNTFVKMSIIFSNKNSLVTKTVKNTLSPVYKEDHVFHTNKSKWVSTNQTCLKLSVFDCDRQGRHDAIGHALLPLSQLSGKKQKHVESLTPMSIPTKNLGQVLVGLSYVPTQSLLSVQVLKARHLRLDADIHKRKPIHKETLDTFAKVTLMCAGQKVKSNASRVVFGAADPFYNFKNSFVLPPQFMLDSSVIVSVVVRGILGRSFTLGRMISGPYTELSDGTPTHWGKMVQENRNVVQWKNLYL